MGGARLSLFRKKEVPPSALDSLPPEVQEYLIQYIHAIFGGVVTMLRGIPPEHRKPIMDEITGIMRGSASKFIGAALTGGEPDEILTSVMASIDLPMFVHRVIASFNQPPQVPGNTLAPMPGESVTQGDPDGTETK